ncbi:MULTISPECIES: DUF2129 domain-containing protein [Bacillus]|uniref:DUF2129 domain-containing protein n=1 Tax=Bacillus TaxID=1386 RepID=UPI000A19C4D9|nr:MULTISPECIES: DUF2129 domain-containing protein [Bacillus cereus group]MEB2589330.1 DUF2129 domain-containing protein [Bacillus cereus]MEB2616225.1 DUF2129 domain-containing protein [Bacillus cereus]OSM10310.1 hypothetical protein BTH38_26125 [Bacillus toyonensis]PEM49568.1 DUF2129 domain-containing protein [Bacillus toyonensis]PEZ57193.1 DUF2129 domain-containing protein [Bacillus cereus]
MKKKISVHLNDMNKVYILEQFGQISYVDDFLDLVFIVVNESEIKSILALEFVVNIEECGRGNLLTA